MEKHCPHCEEIQKKPSIFKNKLLITSLLIAAILVIGQILNIFKPLQQQLINYLRMVTLPIILGLLLGGFIDWLIPSEYISRLLAGNKKRTIINAVLAGFLMSACSHGILAISIQLYKKGASPAAVVAFLLASPWANMAVTILIIGLFGMKGLLFILSAIIVALITGTIFLILDKYNLIEKNKNTIILENKYSIIEDIKIRIINNSGKITAQKIGSSLTSIIKGSAALANMILWWIFIGIIISSVIGAYIPTEWMVKYMGASIAGIFVTLAFATIIEICSEGTAPLAFEIFAKTGAFGNSFVFLMAGVVTDYTEIGLIWTNIGKRTAIWLPIIVVPQVVALGIIFNKYL